MVEKSEDSTNEKKAFEKEEKQRTLLERLGFVQEVFEFYTAPIN